VDDREHALDDREHTLDAREHTCDARERAVDDREQTIDDRDDLVDVSTQPMNVLEQLAHVGVGPMYDSEAFALPPVLSHLSPRVIATINAEHGEHAETWFDRVRLTRLFSRRRQFRPTRVALISPEAVPSCEHS